MYIFQKVFFNPSDQSELHIVSANHCIPYIDTQNKKKDLQATLLLTTIYYFQHVMILFMELTAEKNVAPTVTNRIVTIQLGNVLSSNRYLHVHCTILKIALH